MGRFVKSAAPPGIALSHFCYRRRKTLVPQGPRKLPKLDVAGSTPVARSRRKPLSDQGVPVASIYDSHPARTALALREKAGRRPRVQREPARGLVDVYAAVIPTSRSAAPSTSTRPSKDSPKEMGGSGETLPECSGSESQESRGDALDDGHEGIVIRFGPHSRRFVVDQVARIRGERPGQLLGLDEPYPLGREELDDGGAVRSTEPIPGAERRVLTRVQLDRRFRLVEQLSDHGLHDRGGRAGLEGEAR